MTALVLIDFSNIAYRWGYGTIADLTKKGNLVTQENLDNYNDGLKAILNFEVTALEKHLGISREQWVWVKDSPPIAKRAIYPLYKTNKSKHKPIDPRNWVKDNLDVPFWAQAVNKNYEADDVIATIAKSNQDKEIVVVSNDSDLWSLMSINVKVFRTHTREFVNESNIVEKYHCQKPKDIILYKTLFGDRSDLIPNCAPRLHKYLLPLIDGCEGDLPIFIDKIMFYPISKVRTKVLSKMEQIKINWKLVLLSDDVVWHLEE